MAEQSTGPGAGQCLESCACTQVFRTFRMAIGRTKLTLALAGVLSMGVWGWVLDGVWRLGDHTPPAGEVGAYWQSSDINGWRKATLVLQLAELETVYREMKVDLELTEVDVPARLAEMSIAAAKPDLSNEDYRELAEDLGEAVGKARKALEEAFDGAKAAKIEALGKEPTDPEKHKAVAKLAIGFTRVHRRLEGLGQRGVGSSFLAYEREVLGRMLASARRLEFTNQTRRVLAARGSGGAELEESTPSVPAGLGVGAYVVLMARGVQWLVREHGLYGVLFLLGSLAIWSLFGGAICRTAALQVARDEQLSMRAALGFARRKFIGFAGAPLMPMAAMLFVGGVLLAGGLAGSIPYVGEVITGLGLGLALIGGVVIALLLVGLIGGGFLMWPAVAVEGSDGFDAFGRSYSYIFAKPWRAGFYATVTLVYGSLCYLFVRVFVWIVLRVTHGFVGLGMENTHRPGTGWPDGTKLDAMWAQPSFDHLMVAAPPFGTETWGDATGGFLICIWVCLLVMLLCAFLASFFLSGSTIIYYLLRQAVDATDFEDVYLDEDLEEDSGSMASDAGPSGEASASGSDRSLPVVDSSPAAPAADAGAGDEAEPDDDTAEEDDEAKGGEGGGGS